MRCVCGSPSGDVKEYTNGMKQVHCDLCVESYLKENPGVQLIEESLSAIGVFTKLMPKVEEVRPRRRLRINFKAYAKLYYWTQVAPKEVSGYGMIFEEEDGNFHLKDAIILDQLGVSAYTELNPEAQHHFLYQLAIKGKSPADFRFWWHSHHYMGCSWSSVDDANIEEHSRKSWYVSLLMHKSGKMEARWDCAGESEDLIVEIIPTGRQRIQKRCGKQIKRLVKEVQTFVSAPDAIEVKC